ncbi:MAG: rifamycin-inactivating phosphotransferase [Nannocystaceae bacterium]
MERDVLDLEEIDATQVAEVGGKGANLGALARIDGVRVPPGFCVTTAAFRRALAAAPRSTSALLERLSLLRPDDRAGVATLSAELRRALEAITVPDDVAAAITSALARHGERAAYAVRSSATAEDLPTASFAGLQDTALNVIGPAAILEHVRRCWASLFTDRAVTYRQRSGLDHRRVHMAVVVQRMVAAEAAGVLFTADPISGHRRVTAIEAVFGLGEALVSGQAHADAYRVRDDAILGRSIARKPVAVVAATTGGTEARAIAAARQDQPALSDPQILRLARLGRTIEARFGRPQDIEWCLVDDDLQIVQSRPITTLFPIPRAEDQGPHVYISVGHQQMMTDAMKPLGRSLFQRTALRPMDEAGGRLFVDVTRILEAPASRAALFELLRRSEPLILDALRSIVERGDLLRAPPDEGPAAPPPAGGAPLSIDPDLAVVVGLIERNQASVAALTREIQGRTGPALLEFIAADLQELKRLLFDRESHQVLMTAMEASGWLNEQMEAWLGERSAADTLTLSVPHNVTSEMGLALLDVADAIRPHPAVVAYLERVHDLGELGELGELDLLEAIADLEGGAAARAALGDFLDRYGARCVGEIDITRPRWRERPAALVPVLLGNLKGLEPGAGARRFELGRQAAEEKARSLLERLRALPDGARKAEETQRRIDQVRCFTGYREYPKFGLVRRYAVYKEALLEEADRMVAAGVLRAREELFFLTFEELEEAVRTARVDEARLRRREEAHRADQALTPPRVLTSEGERVAGAYRRDDLPAGALVGLAVSAGTVEGRARVVLDLAEADLEAGDVLVTAYTDPSWTPLFLAIKGLVTEVGGLMSHGSVIAREYGLPAVVGVEDATRRIRDGQRIRVHGTDGYVELLD